MSTLHPASSWVGLALITLILFAGAPFLPLLGALCLKRTLLLVKSSSKGFHQRIEHSVVAELDIPKLFSAFAAFLRNCLRTSKNSRYSVMQVSQ